MNNKYMQALLDYGYNVYDAGNDFTVICLFAFDANRFWTDEEPGKFQLEETMANEYYPVTIYVLPDGTIELTDGQHEEYFLILPSLRVEQESELPDILQQLEKAFGNETTLKNGTKIVQSVLESYSRKD